MNAFWECSCSLSSNILLQMIDLSLWHSKQLPIQQLTIRKIMNITDITHERLQIAVNAIERDTSISETIQMGFKTLYQCIYEQKLSTSIIESQLNQKVGMNEFSYGLAQKLSVNEFLKYFEKIEKLVEGVEAQTIESEDIIQKKIQSELKKFEQSVCKIKRELDGKRKGKNSQIQIMQEQINKVKDDLHQIISLKSMEPLYLSHDANKENQSHFSQQALADELRTIQEYCEESKSHLDTLIHQSTTQYTQYVSFGELREIMGNLQGSISKSISSIISENPNKKSFDAYWITPDNHDFAIFPNLPKNNKIWSIDQTKSRLYLRQEGIYQITCCFFPLTETELHIMVNGHMLVKHRCSEIPKNNLGRNIMLSVKLGRDSWVGIRCISEEMIEGSMLINYL